ncbi:GumC family protein [Larkinella soli]|uniref:GumC family protein n=1 Tax=Larkinella soli TaxID=1770527 RepID=UPI000FFC8398|nr:tyrosine-protein kinase [Larkinella soli]
MITTPYVYQQYEDKEPDVRAIIFKYLKNWKWFLVSLVVCLASGYVYLKYQVPLYKVQSSILIKDDKKGLSEETIMKELDLFAPKKVVENEVEILKSYTLMEKVVNDLELDVSYFRETPVGEREIYQSSPIRLVVESAGPELYEDGLKIEFINPKTVRILEKNYPVNQSVNTPVGRLRIFPKAAIAADSLPVIAHVAPKQEVVQEYLDKLKVDPTSKQSTVLQLSMEEAVPQKGRDILDKLVEQYNDAALEDKNLVASNTLDFIEERLRLISGELATVEKDVEVYKSTQGITDISTESQIFLQSVQQNDAELTKVNIQITALEDVERFIRSKSGERGATPATLGLSDPTLLGLIGKVTELELQRDNLARTTSENNPLLSSLDDQIRATKGNIRDNIQTMKRILMGTRGKLMADNNKYESMIRTVPRKERDLLNITRQQAIKNNLYTYLLAKREETALSYASTVADSRTIDRARSSNEPVKPKKALVFLLFGAFGFLLPIGAFAVRDMMNDRIGQRSDVEALTQTPIIGEIAYAKHSFPLVVTSRSRSIVAEQVRALRTNLQFLRSNNECLAVLFTSSISGEGKSFISLNLGASLALIDRPTIILEMDLRRPKLHAMLGVDGSVGISNFLIGQTTLDEIIQPVPGMPNYFILPSGPVPPNPAELLVSDKLDEMFRQLRERFEFIIVDSPPIGLVTDAQIIADKTDATLFVVRHDVTPKPHVRMVESMYKEQKFRKLSLILNSINQGQGYGYNYGYGYGYYEQASDKRKPLLKKLLSGK